MRNTTRWPCVWERHAPEIFHYPDENWTAFTKLWPSWRHGKRNSQCPTKTVHRPSQLKTKTLSSSVPSSFSLISIMCHKDVYLCHKIVFKLLFGLSWLHRIWLISKHIYRSYRLILIATVSFLLDIQVEEILVAIVSVHVCAKERDPSHRSRSFRRRQHRGARPIPGRSQAASSKSITATKKCAPSSGKTLASSTCSARSAPSLILSINTINRSYQRYVNRSHSIRIQI